MTQLETFDAVVVGGGVIGAATLFNLARLGCRRALLLERGELAGGATSRSSGIVRTHYSVPANVDVARASLRIFEDFAAELSDHEADSGLVRSGYLIMAPPGPASDAVRRSIAMQRGKGIECALLDRAEALDRHAWLQLDGIDAIGFEAEAGFADPYLVTTSYARAARRLGATIRTNTAVTGLLRDGDRVIGVQTADGPIEAAVTLSAVNIWTRSAPHLAGLDLPSGISAHHVFSLEADRPYAPELPVLKDLASPSRLYMRPSGGRLLVGAGDDGLEVNDPEQQELDPDMDRIADEAEQAAHRLPAFADGRLTHVWSGLYDVTPDWNPVLGPAPGLPGLHLAFGFSGHGFKLAPMVSRMLAQSMLGVPADLPLHPYRLERFAEGDLLLGAYGGGAVS